MPTDSQLIRYCAEALRAFGSLYAPPGMPAFPTDEPVPDPAPPSVKTITFASGISVTGAVGQSITMQPHRLLVLPGVPFTFSGGTARRGCSARAGLDSWGAGLFNHAVDPSPVQPEAMTLGPGDSIVIAAPLAGNQFVKLREAVLVEAYVPDATGRTFPWPSVVRGATQEDVGEFLRTTDWLPETIEGWTGRAGHALANFGTSGEDGYGGVIAERTSFGALLMASDLDAGQKGLVWVRMLDMADDAHRAEIDFPPDGGHGIGRLFPRLVRAAAGKPLSNQRFAELLHVVPNPGGPNFGGYGWRHHETDPVDMASSYVTACAANRWGGAALVAGLAWPGDPTLQPWVVFTRAYLRQADPTSWTHTKHERSRQLILANASALGLS